MTYLAPPPLDFASSRLRDKIILITGASSGIGKAAARLFAREDAIVIGAARDLSRTQRVIDDIVAAGGRGLAVACDVCDEASIERAIAAAVERHGRLDGAFNNAGLSLGKNRKRVHLCDAEDFDRVIATNLRGVFLCIKHQVAAMLKTGGGSIVNTSSISGLIGAPGNSIYAASKFGLMGIVKCAALEYAREGIRINSIAPGPTRSQQFDAWADTEEMREQIAGAMPMNYIADPEDMARAALFLLSDESRWTTGTILPCEGGKSAG